jgi:membrane associated rhomboid family serine protease
MLSERDYNQQSTRKWRWSATIVLVALNVIAFLVQTKILAPEFNETYLELSKEGLRAGYVWELLSYQFMHGGWMHLVLNCWALFVFGRGVEWAVGKPRFLALYFTSGIAGGLLQVLAGALWPQYFSGSTVGASAGVMGVIATFAMLFPDQPLVMLLLYVIPIKMRARSLLWVILILTALGISFPLASWRFILGGNVAHFGHLGGILTGLAFTRFYFLKARVPPPQAG